MGFIISKKTYIVRNQFSFMVRIIFEKTVNADIQKTFDVLTDFENFEKMLPNYYTSITTKSIRDESSLVVEHLHLAGNEFIMMAKHFMKSPVIHEMRVVGGDIKGSHIIEKLDQVNGKTKIFVDASINVSKRTKISFKKSNYEDEIKKLYQKFIEYIEN